ncbi:MAG: response regulator [Sandaracinaceae bacterium]|nr:response regulator [Sandaracinaceae bacterium]
MADVLIVDDDGDLAEVTAMILESAGHRTRRAADGREGLDRLRERLPDVVVLDVEMPHQSGPDLAYRMLVEDAGMERVPVLLVSGCIGLDEVAVRVGTPTASRSPTRSRPSSRPSSARSPSDARRPRWGADADVAPLAPRLRRRAGGYRS